MQLYAVRSRRNWGHGDFTDLAALIELAADVGATGIGLNPLHALFSDLPQQASPYGPNSRLFLNPLYIDVAALPEFSAEIALDADIEKLRSTGMVDYAGVARAKLAALRRAYDEFRRAATAERKTDFEQFRAERGRTLARFAAFETLRGRFPTTWREWPEPWRKPGDRAVQELRTSEPDAFGFHEFLQWVADRQLKACRDLARHRGMAVGLYIDLAVGVDPAGADAWMDQEVMLTGLSVGAPPDALNTAGQSWGLTTYNPHSLVARSFEPLREMLRAAMRYAGAVRLDHVLGLMHIYVVPQGSSARDGAYLRFPFLSMLDVIADESRRHQCTVIGEDLGTVPEGLRDTLAAWGVWSYLVVLFEREWGGAFKHPSRYAVNALATFNTHDLPTFTGWLSGHDLAVKRGIGLDPGETDQDRENTRLAWRAAASAVIEPSFDHVAEFLAATPARLVAVQLEDILDVRDQINVPGTVMEHPNWRRRLPAAIEDLRNDQRLVRIAAAFSRAGRGST